MRAPIQTLAEIRPCPTPQLDKLFKVFVTMASNPSNFVVRIFGMNLGDTNTDVNFPGKQVRISDDEQHFLSMMNNIQEYANDCRETVSVDTLLPGKCFAGQNQDNVWYR